MRHAFRFALAAILAAVTTLIGWVPSTIRAAVDLTASALYMGGTDHPLSIPEDTTAYITDYIGWAYDNYVGPSGLCVGGDPGCAQVAVQTPAQFWPITGLNAMQFDHSVALGVTNLDNCLRGVACTVTDPPFTTTGSRPLTDTSYTVFSYSQSGTVASIEKSDLIAHPPTGTVNFVFESNPNRPNGGILERFVGVYIPILGVSFNGATVTNSPEPTPLTTVDVVHQYDPVADFPTNPLNLLADLNALMGFLYEHPEGGTGPAQLQGQYQDSTYYLVPTATGSLPIVRPLNLIPFLGPLLATVLDPPLRVLVETGFDRTINPGSPTPAKYLYFPNPITTAVNFLTAIPTGWDNGIAYLTGDPANRPFGTAPQGPYGVGGPPVDTGAIDPYGPPTPVVTQSVAAVVPAPSAAQAEPAQVVQRTRPAVRAAAVTAHEDSAPHRTARSAGQPSHRSAQQR
ncbi:MAG: PE-PPE domain-containing protein [Mycobacterium sp.]